MVVVAVAAEEAVVDSFCSDVAELVVDVAFRYNNNNCNNI